MSSRPGASSDSYAPTVRDRVLDPFYYSRFFIFTLCFRTSAWTRVRVYDLSIIYVFVTLD
jgi:hypothetical protein